MAPFQQGDLDGLCGVYSIINALKAIGIRRSVEEWQIILNDIINHLQHNKKSNLFLTDGITTTDISRILRDIIVPKFGIHYHKPFHKNSELPLEDLWELLLENLVGEKRRSAIFCIAGANYSHWTVTTALSDRRILLQDSYKMHWINRSQCSTTELLKNSTVMIYPTTLFLLERDIAEKP